MLPQPWRRLKLGIGMNGTKRWRTVGALLVLAAAAVSPANAAELKIFGSRVTKVIVGELGPQFEKATGYTPVVVADVAAVMKRRIEAGEPFDLAVLVDFQIDDLIKSGKLLADSRADIMSSGIGVAVKRGAPKPDIGTVEAFKQTMLKAKSVTYLKEGASTIHLRKLFDSARHRRRDQVEGRRDGRRNGVRTGRRRQSRTRPHRHSQYHVGAGRRAGRPAAGGDQLDRDVHRRHIGAVAEPAAARELIKLLKSPEAKPVIKAKGNDPA